MRLDNDLNRLAAEQHSCLGTWQLRQLGASHTEVNRLTRSSRWERVSKRVLRLAGSPETDLQIASAAVLDAGPDGALDRESGAALWDLGGSYRLVPAQVMVTRATGAHGATVGHARPRVGVSDRWITKVDGIRVVRPEWCVYQLCGIVNPLKAERALDTAWAKGLLSGCSLRRCLEDLAEHGRNGTVVLRALLDARPVGYVPPATGIEARFDSIMNEHGLGEWRRQIDSGGETWAGRVDFRHMTLPLIAEVLSERYHASLSSQADDVARRERLEAAGFVIVEVWDSQVWYRVNEVLAIVRDGVLRARGRAA